VDQNKNIPEPELKRLFDDIGPTLGWESMLLIAVQGCLTRYLGANLQGIDLIAGAQTQRSLLDIALVPTPDSESFNRPVVFKLILSFGAKPNRKFEDQNPWQNGLSYLITNHDHLSPAMIQFWAEIVIVLLENGARPLTQCHGPEKFEQRGKSKKKISVGNLWTAEEVISRVFDGSGERTRLLALLKGKGRPEKKSKCRQQ
jgi:hypothetical protein